MKRPLGRVEQVGRVALLLPGQGGGGRGPARVAAQSLQHHHVDGQAAHVHPQFPHRARHVAGHAAEAGAVVSDSDVVVHGLGDAHDGDPPVPAHRRQLAAGVHGAVAAVHQHVADVLLRQDIRHAGVVLRLQGVPGGADGGGGGGGQPLQLLLGHRAEVQQLLLQQSAGAAHSAVNMLHQAAGLGLPDRPIQGAVEHGGGAAPVNDDQVLLQWGSLLVFSPFRLIIMPSARIHKEDFSSYLLTKKGVRTRLARTPLLNSATGPHGRPGPPSRSAPAAQTRPGHSAPERPPLRRPGCR